MDGKGSQEQLLSMYRNDLHDLKENYDFLDDKLDELLKKLRACNKVLIKKIQEYDIEIEKLRLFQLRNKAQSTEEQVQILEEAHQGLGRKFPIESLEEFVAFDTSLECTDKKKFIRLIIIDTIIGYNNLQESISTIIAMIMRKAVQEQYSGQGKISINGQKKLSFYDTQVFNCIACVLKPKFKVSDEYIISKIGKYLTGARHREKGRANNNQVNA